MWLFPVDHTYGNPVYWSNGYSGTNSHNSSLLVSVFIIIIAIIIVLDSPSGGIPLRQYFTIFWSWAHYSLPHEHCWSLDILAEGLCKKRCLTWIQLCHFVMLMKSFILIEFLLICENDCLYEIKLPTLPTVLYVSNNKQIKSRTCFHNNDQLNQQCIWTWISNYIHIIMWDVIVHPC